MDYFSSLPNDIHNLIFVYLDANQLNNIINVYNIKVNHRFLFDNVFSKKDFLFNDIVNFNITDLYMQLSEVSELINTKNVGHIAMYLNREKKLYPVASKYLLGHYIVFRGLGSYPDSEIIDTTKTTTVTFKFDR